MSDGVEAADSRNARAMLLNGDTGNRAGFVLFMLFLISALNFMDRVIVSALLPLIQADLRFSDSEAGLLTGVVFAATYSISGFPLAHWVDRGNRRNLLSLAVGFWSVATACCGLAVGFGQLLIARMAVGIGEGGGMPASHSLICDYFPPHRRPGAIGVQMAGTSIGSLLGFAGAGYIGSRYGWRAAFIVAGLVGILLSIATRLSLHEPLRGVFDQNDKAPAYGGWEAFRRQLSNTTLIHLVFAFAGIGFCAIGLQQWAPTFYFRYHSASLSTVGVLYGLAYGIGALLGMLGGGIIGNAQIKRTPASPLLFCAAAFIAAIPLALGSLLVTSIAWSLILAFLAAMVTSVSSGPIFSAIYSSTPVETRALVTATTMFVVAILGIGLGPAAIGVASDLLVAHAGDDSLRLAMVGAAVMQLWPAAHAYLAARSMTSIRLKSA